VGDVQRFSSIKKAISYCGLCGAEKSSGSTVQRQTRLNSRDVLKAVLSRVSGRLLLTSSSSGWAPTKSNSLPPSDRVQPAICCKTHPSSDLVAAVRAVSRGEAVCPSQLCSALFRFVVQSAREMHLQNSTPKPELTLRQQQLVGLVARGLTNKEIASHLNLSEFTVRNHIHRILKQVDAGSRSEAVETIRAYGYPISP
jgi:DNA-binding CsgD family transcriptional regulator